MKAEHPHPGSYATSVEEIVALYRTRGAHHYDEALSQIDHALQTAALAADAGAGDALIAAALLHDVGHLLDLEASGASWTNPGEDLHHETVGAKYLSGLFPPSVTAPIALHVRAKRYRTAVDPEYFAGLSAGSVASLAKQGGPMSAEEIAGFESNPGHADAVALRGWDDSAKREDLEVAPLEHYLELLHRLNVRPTNTAPTNTADG